MKKYALFLGAVALLFLSGCASPTERDQQAILGTWQIIRIEEDGLHMEGMELAEYMGNDRRFQFCENGIIKVMKDENSKGYGYELNAEKKPKWITLKDDQDEDYAIYRLEGDVLHIATGQPHGPRPTAFSGKDIMITTFQREKP